MKALCQSKGLGGFRGFAYVLVWQWEGTPVIGHWDSGLPSRGLYLLGTEYQVARGYHAKRGEGVGGMGLDCPFSSICPMDYNPQKAQ